MKIEDLVKELRSWADCDARSGEPLGARMRKAADKLEELADALAHANHMQRLTQDARNKAEAALAEAKRENEALRELVDSAESILTNCSVTDGVCCCGDNMETHPSPMSCGHEPVDHGAFLVAVWLESRDVVGGNNGK